MRTFLSITTGLTLLAISACENGPGDLKDPPLLKVTSPTRSLVGQIGQLQVTGTTTPNPAGDKIVRVLVNDVEASIAADGSFTAMLDIKPGATLIHTVARDKRGGEAEDTRAVQAGELRAAGANIDNAVTAAISSEAFAKISAAAGPTIAAMDLKPMLLPMQPMVHFDDEQGEDCFFARVYVDDVKMSGAKVSLIPVQGGLKFSAEIDGLYVPTHARYAAACLDGSNSINVSADSVIVTGDLLVSPDGMHGFKTTLDNPHVALTNFHLDADGVPGDILDLINMDTAISFIVSQGAQLAMGPMMNQALGALAGPQKLLVMGKMVDVMVTPSNVSFDPSGGVVGLDMKMLVEGSEASPGFIFTDNGNPTLDPGTGFQLGLADDLANELMAEASAVGMLNLSMPSTGGTFDTAKMSATLPPMISADPADGKLKVILGDMAVTYTQGDVPVAKAAMNVKLEVQIVPAANGYGVALQLGTPEIHVDVVDDIPNLSRFTTTDLASASQGCLGAQINNLSLLLANIPLPAIAGLKMRDLSVAGKDGYVMVKGAFE